MIVWGYWEKNLGDDLFLISLINKLENIEYEKKKITICTYKKYKTYYENMGISVYVRDSFFYKVLNKLSRLIFKNEYYYLKAKNNIFLMLGGSLFAQTDNDSYTQQIINLNYASLKAKYSFVIGSNFGPYTSNEFYESYYKIFSLQNDICFRDHYSFEKFSSLSQVRYGPDAILEGFWEKKSALFQDVEPYIIMSVIDLNNKPTLKKYANIYENTMVEIVKSHISNGETVKLISFCDSQGDIKICNKIKNRLANSTYISVIDYSDPVEIAMLFKNAKKTYATRFHAIILSLYYDVPCIPIIYDQKSVNAIESYCSKETYIYIRELNMKIIQNILNNEILIHGKENIIKNDLHFSKLVECLYYNQKNN